MCWACDKDEAEALLKDSRVVFAEADKLRQHAGHMQAQAYGAKHKAEQRREENSDICKEVEDACKNT